MATYAPTIVATANGSASLRRNRASGVREASARPGLERIVVRLDAAARTGSGNHTLVARTRQSAHTRCILAGTSVERQTIIEGRGGLYC